MLTKMIILAYRQEATQADSKAQIYGFGGV